MSLALYRRYRPETFDEVIGQEHVTEPLSQALRNDRVHHAYLFSGPRGCGKTTSARILARCLNCEKGPTPTPCGVCDSCQGLARGGPGTMDVIEIDAASHGGVDDARDLRDRAFFSPAASRYKIYIVDEAHMVSSAGFNALLKVVEEPPEHLKFIFATTEPEKVIGTIRSRTHHYPFRLVPPGRLQAYLAELCAQEGVTVEKPVLPLVVRAGRGSVRDALSVLDQLLAGAGPTGVTYRLAVALLGYTDATLLDDTVEAFAAGDGASVFAVIERVIEGGHDPRRFAEDLLERLRDLVILDAIPDAAPSMFGEVPADQLERMRQQAARFGPAELSRAADLVNTGLTEMRGVTTPRLQLELICARVLLPEAADDPRSLQARLDRLERRLALVRAPGPSAPPVADDAPVADAAATSFPSVATSSPPAAEPAATSSEPGVEPARETAGPHPEPTSESTAGSAAEPAIGQPAPAPDPNQPPAAVPVGGLDLSSVRRTWPDILDAVKNRRRFTWSLLSHNAQVAAIGDRTLTLAMLNAGARDSFVGSGSDEIVRQAVIDVLGVDWRVETIVDPSHGPGRSGGATAVPSAAATGTTGWGGSRASGEQARAGEAPGGHVPPPAGGGGPPQDDVRDDETGTAAYVAPEHDVPSPDDPDLDEAGLSQVELLQRDLGAKVIGEYDAD